MHVHMDKFINIGAGSPFGRDVILSAQATLQLCKILCK